MIIDVAAALIRNDEGQFLICQRPAHKARGLLWEFVGGKQESGETLEQTLVRECTEELDITVAVGRIYAQLLHEYPDIHIRLTLFECTIAQGTPSVPRIRIFLRCLWRKFFDIPAKEWYNDLRAINKEVIP